MLALIYKDMKLQKIGFRGMLMAVVILLIVSSTDMRFDMINGLLIPIVLYSFSLVSVTYDRYFNAEKIILSMPVTKNELVMSKYISVAIGAIVACCVAFIANLGISYKLGINFNDLWNTQKVFQITAGTLIAVNIMIPIHIKAGLIKGKIISTLILGVLFGCVFAISSFNLIDISWINSFSTQMILCGVLIVSLMISYVSTIKIMNGRDI